MQNVSFFQCFRGNHETEAQKQACRDQYPKTTQAGETLDDRVQKCKELLGFSEVAAPNTPPLSTEEKMEALKRFTQRLEEVTEDFKERSKEDRINLMLFLLLF
jgi:hypothetical protein